MLGKIFSVVVGWMLKSKSAKIGGGILGGSGVFAGLFSVYTWTVDGINDRAKAAEVRVVKYVDDKHSSALAEFRTTVDHIKTNQQDMKTLLLRMDKRLYELKGGN